MPYVNITFPVACALGAIGGPRFSTAIVGTLGGEEQRNQDWYAPLWQWEVGLVNKSRADTYNLISFFRQVHGMRDTFNFVNYLPGQASAVKRARFTVDHLDIARIDPDLFSWPSVRITEVRIR